MEFVYLYVVKDVKRNVPHPWILFVFGVVGSIGLGAGVGGFIAYLGLGILDTINNRGTCLQIVVMFITKYVSCGLTLYQD